MTVWVFAPARPKLWEENVPPARQATLVLPSVLKTAVRLVSASDDLESAPKPSTLGPRWLNRFLHYFHFILFQLVMSRRRELRISRGDSQLAVENGYIVVPGDTHDAVIGVSKLFDVPIYW